MLQCEIYSQNCEIQSQMSRYKAKIGIFLFWGFQFMLVYYYIFFIYNIR